LGRDLRYGGSIVKPPGAGGGHVAERPIVGLAKVVRTRPEPERARSSPYTDVRGIAEHLDLTERHIRRLVLERRIPHRKVGNLLRFHIVEVDRWMDTLQRGPVLEPAAAVGRGIRRPRTA
jgi:excisionase family DNA binding protein